MTRFEELAMEMLNKVEVGADGFYVGHTRVLAQLTTEVIISDDEEIFNLPWEKQRDIIKTSFYRLFPYLER